MVTILQSSPILAQMDMTFTADSCELFHIFARGAVGHRGLRKTLISVDRISPAVVGQVPGVLGSVNCQSHRWYHLKLKTLGVHIGTLYCPLYPLHSSVMIVMSHSSNGILGFGPVLDVS